METTMSRTAKLDHRDTRRGPLNDSPGGEPSRQRARIYEQGLSAHTRRNNGAVYTPHHLVAWILDLAEFSPSEPIERLRVLDPACGCGVFLAHAACRLAERLQKLGVILNSEDGAHRFLKLVESNLFGVDKDRVACELARDVVADQVRTLAGRLELPPDFFRSNICAADYLDDTWKLSNGASGPPSFDLIVGNPPYVTTSRLTDEDKHSFRNRFKTAYGRIDLYSLFFERSTELLSPSGTLAFITPDKFLTSESGGRLRSLLRDRTTVRTIARFDSHQVFKNAAIVPCITVASKPSQANHTTEILHLAKSDSLSEIRIDDRWKAHIPQHSDSAWRLFSPEVSTILQTMEERGTALGKLSARISAGIATGRDGIYVVSEAVGSQLEEDLLNPALRGKDIRPFGIARTSEYVIVPYRDTDSAPVLVDLDHFPRTKAYLESHQKELRNRHCVRRWGKSWYDIHDPWTFNLTKTPKILFPDIANGNRFVFDAGNRCPLHSVYYLVPNQENGEYLTAILNTEAVEFYIRARAPIAKDGFSRYRRQFLCDVPVPQATAADQRAVVEAARRGSLLELNDLVSCWLGLTGAQRRQVSDFVIQARSGGG